MELLWTQNIKKEDLLLSDVHSLSISPDFFYGIIWKAIIVQQKENDHFEL
jgi:hypothetical protein